MKRINWSAVFIGLLVDIGGTMFLAFLLVFAQNLAGVTILDPSAQDVDALLIQFVFGMAFTIFGGFVAGMVAQRDFVLNGALVGALSLVFSGISLAFDSTTPLWYEAAAAIAVTPAAALGGLIASVIGRRETQ